MRQVEPSAIREFGIERKHQITVRLSTEENDALRDAAFMARMSMSNYVRRAVKAAMEDGGHG